jgi:uncharacterized protein (TIGR03437 family)
LWSLSRGYRAYGVGAAPVAPGGLMSIFGVNLDGTTMIRMGDYTVPLLWVGPYQINAQAPWELAGQTNTQLVISNGNAIDVPLATYAPGIFVALPAAGGSRVKPGDYVTIYANGLGSVMNQPPTGAGAVTDPLSKAITMPEVTIGGLESPDVQYAGLAPVWVGLYQVNAQVPKNATPGDNVPLYLETGGLRSNTVTIGVD